MANYYFLATLLPPLKVGSPPEIGSKELDFLLEQTISSKDFEKIICMRRLIDIENIRAILTEKPFQPGGNIAEKDLEEKLLLQQDLPLYILEYLMRYPEKESRLTHFSELLHSYFHKEGKKQSGFLAKYLNFEWQWRLCFVALRAKELERDLAHEMRFENPDDPFVSEILAQKDSASFSPPAPYGSLKALFESRKNAPMELYQALSEWRFSFLDEMTEGEYFSFNKILGYITQLAICEQWIELNTKKGFQILQELIET